LFVLITNKLDTLNCKSLRTAIQALITRRSVTTVNPVRVVTLHLARLVHQFSITDHVTPSPPTTVPVLLTAVGVSVVAIRLAGAVQVMTTVNLPVRAGGWFVAVLVTLVTDRPIPALSVLKIVAAFICWVKHLGVTFLIIRTEEVLGLCFFVEAMPVPPAVVLVREPSGAHVLAAYLLVIRGAVWGNSWGGFTVLIALVTYRPSVTLGVLSKVAAVIRKVIHLGVAIIIIGAEDMFSFRLSLVTMPVLPAIELVREVASSCLHTVNDLVRGSTVGLLRCGGYRGRAVLGIITRSVTTVHIMRVGTPGILDVKLVIILAVLMCHTTRITFIILPA